jgi:putative membrane-bound dehydrogenase-like protein
MKRFPIIVAASVLCLAARAADLVPVPDFGLRLQRGFNISLVADNNLATDTYCMTFDSRGRLFVANSQSIRMLTDTDGDGVADTATVFANLSRGAMGMCFDGNTLYVAGDQALWRFQDQDGNGVADGPAEKIGGFGFGEHGAHAMRKGPDGYWYFIGGNDTGFTAQNVTSADSPIRKVDGGAMLRFTPDFGNAECIAHGFRNPYDFDFNWAGDIFTYDSDTERDAFLPWYVPTRLYHVAHGQHHGWRLSGHQRSWPRPEYYADTAEILSRVGRGSPTGVEMYRHVQFPPAFRDALFFADWTFGKIFVAPLTPDDATYDTTPDLFLEPMGTQGFAPTDLAVSPDGALYISIGGRKTRGSVYRIEWGGLPFAPQIAALLNLDVNNVLTAPQPLDAWSRATWVPIAQRIGAQPFAAVATDENISPVFRVRAIEVLTEVFGGIPEQRIGSLVQSPVPAVRARTAWSVGRTEPEDGDLVLRSLALDTSPSVRRVALEAFIDDPTFGDPVDVARVIAANLSHADKRVRLAALKLATRATDEAWQSLDLRGATPLAQANGLLAEMGRTPDKLVFPQMVPRLTNLLAQARDPQSRLDAVRAAIFALGDWRLNDPSVEVFAGYETAVPIAPEFAPVLPRVRALFPSGNTELDLEAARLLAMFQDEDPRTVRVLATSLTDTSPAAQDFHFLACLARMRAPIAEHAPRIARAILSLDRKLNGQELRTKQNWDVRLAELVQQFTRREPAIGDALLRDPLLPLPAHVELATGFTGERRVTAARRFLTAARANRTFVVNNQLVELLASLPQEEVFPIFRALVNNPGIRDAIVLKLATAPAPADRATFLGSLASPQPQVVRASLEALLKLPPDAAGTNLVMPLRVLRRGLAEPQETSLRAQLVTLISTSLKQEFKIMEPPGGNADALRVAYAPVFNFVGQKYPGLIRLMNADDGEDPVRWNNTLRSVPWAMGDLTRGQQIFTERGCAACHTSGGAFGPDLSGSMQRMSREDVLTAIAFPSRDIAPAYRAVTFRMRDGQVISGIVAFESADGWLVQTGAGSSVRLDSADVVSREPSSVSLMPAGLLGGLPPAALADLYTYLKSIQPRTAR